MVFSKKHFFQILVLFLLFIKISETIKNTYPIVNQDTKIMLVAFDDTEIEDRELEENHKLSQQNTAVKPTTNPLKVSDKDLLVIHYNSLHLEYITPPPKLIFS